MVRQTAFCPSALGSGIKELGSSFSFFIWCLIPGHLLLWNFLFFLFLRWNMIHCCCLILLTLIQMSSSYLSNLPPTSPPSYTFSLLICSLYSPEWTQSFEISSPEVQTVDSFRSLLAVTLNWTVYQIHSHNIPVFYIFKWKSHNRSVLRHTLKAISQ